MGALGHFFEEEGIATTQISLVREHTVQVRPPRALWVSFELGRPLGLPDDPMFQKKVLASALRLLNARSGPVLEDFPEDVPIAEDLHGWVCPVDLGGNTPTEEGDGVEAKLLREISSLAPWYELAVNRRNRTTVGSSGLEIREAGKFAASFLADQSVSSPVPELTSADALNLACEDLKAYYLEAATARGGHFTSREPAEWFWNQTAAGEIIKTLKKCCLESPDRLIRLLGIRLLVPMSQLSRD